MSAAFVSACEYVRPLEKVCEERLGPSLVHVVAAPIEYTTDLSVPGADLTRKGAVGEGRFALGLTETNIKSSVNVRATGITNPLSHRHCLRPNIDVTLAFSPMTVYIGHEYPEGSCRFLMTMQHELQHVAIYREFLIKTAPEVERTLREYYGSRILYFDSEAEGARRIADDTRDRLGPLVEDKMQQVQVAQTQLDTRDEYDRLQRACGG